jgi:cytochrome b involved in lipid metabolism
MNKKTFLLVVGGLAALVVVAAVVMMNERQPVSEAVSTTAEAPSTRLVSATEVAAHATAADCWVIVSGKVYDVTKMVAIHPGGSEAIVANCGQDGSAAFMTKGKEPAMSHSDRARATLEKLLVGSLQ